MGPTGTIPKVNNGSREKTLVGHCEYFADLYSGNFTVDSPDATDLKIDIYRLNPCNPDLFPWLAQVAANYQEYEVRGILVIFKTTSSDLSTTLSLGTIIMAAEYNCLAEAPSSKVEMENMENAGSTKPSASLIMPIECARANNVTSHLYVGPLGGEQTGDLRLYDLCNIYIATQGIPKENVPLGELWISYEIDLIKPRIYTMPVVQKFLSWSAAFTGAINSSPIGVDEDSFVVDEGSSPDFEVGSVAVVDDGDVHYIQFPNIIGQNWLILAYWVQETSPTTGLGHVPGLLGSNIVLRNAFQEPGFFTYSNVARAVYVNKTDFQSSSLVAYIGTVVDTDPSSEPFIRWDNDGSLTTTIGHCTVVITAFSNDVLFPGETSSDILPVASRLEEETPKENARRGTVRPRGHTTAEHAVSKFRLAPHHKRERGVTPK